MLFSMYSRILEWVNKKDLGVWLYKNKWVSFTYKRVSFTYKQGRYVCHVSDGKGNVEWRGTTSVW